MKNKIIVILVILFLSIGCASKNINPNFWQDREQTIGVGVIEPDKANYWQFGGADIFGPPFNLVNHLNELDISPFYDIRDKFVNEFNKRGINAKKIEKLVSLKGEGSKKELKQIAEDENVDKILLFQINNWGLLRKYHPMFPIVPIERPKAYLIPSFFIYDTNKNRTEFKRKYWLNREILVPIGGEWKQPPDYENLTATIYNNIERVKDMLFDDFFEKNK